MKNKVQASLIQRPKFVYYDIGGVLLDFRDANIHLAKFLGVDVELLKIITWKYMEPASIGTYSAVDLWHAVLNDLGVEYNPDLDYNEVWNRGCNVLEKGHDDLLKLSEQYPVGLFTNIWPDCLPIALEKKLIPNLDFAAIVESWRIKTRKPEEAAYEIAEERIGLSGADILFIDDSLPNLEIAQSRNWQVLKVEESIDKYL